MNEYLTDIRFECQPRFNRDRFSLMNIPKEHSQYKEKKR